MFLSIIETSLLLRRDDIVFLADTLLSRVKKNTLNAQNKNDNTRLWKMSRPNKFR